MDVGTYSIKITAYGNDLYEDSNKETVVVVKKQSKIFLRNALYFVLQTKMVQVTLWDANNKPLAGKTVYLSLDEYGIKYSGVTGENGNAYIRIGVGFVDKDGKPINTDGETYRYIINNSVFKSFIKSSGPICNAAVAILGSTK